MQVLFNVDANTARLIGRENVSKLDGAILELVKNAYDADASLCILYFEESTNSVYLIDNGSGMDDKAINENWMTIGYSAKKDKYKSTLGRVQTGAKGIGRFALDRIADECSMFSKTENSSVEWKVNWSDFNSGKKITEIGADLNNVSYNFNDFVEGIKNNQLKHLIAEELNKSGTAFKLNILRDNWSEDSLKATKKSLATLMPPEMSDLFQIFVFSETCTKNDAKIQTDSGVYSYDYKIEFDVTEEGYTTIQIHRNEFDFGDKFNEIMEEADFQEQDVNYFKDTYIIRKSNLGNILSGVTENTIGSFRGSLYFSKLTQQKIEQEKYFYKDISSRRDSQAAFGGIKLYRDNFRVRPYGELKSTAYDWLLLSNRRSKSPAAISHPTGSWRVTAEQMLGAIHISRDNLTLPDQSNREGIVETREFRLLREFVIHALKEMEKDRQYVIRTLRKYNESKTPISSFEEEISTKAKKQTKIEKKIQRKHGAKKKNSATKESYVEANKAQAVIDEKVNQIKDLEEEKRLLRALATTGIVTNTYIHEIKEATDNLGLKIVTARNKLKEEISLDKIAEYLDDAYLLQQSFKSWFKVTVEMVKRDKRTMRFNELKPLVETHINTWGSVLADKPISIKIEVDNISFKCFPYDIESIFSNLIANSVKSFERENNKDFIISIKVLQNAESELLIKYTDNGLGLNDKYKATPRQIIEPFETSLRDANGDLDGTGMGMWIINNTVKEYKGDIDLSQNISSKEGFYIEMSLKGEIK